MRRTPVSCLLAATLLAGPLAAGSAAAEAPRLVATGDRTASTVVTFSRKVTVQNRTVGDTNRSAAVSGAGDFAGYLLTDLAGRRLYTGVLLVRASSGAAARRYEVGGEQAVLPAGRYLLTLVASGRTEVKIPVDGLSRKVTYQPRTAVPASLARPDLPDMSLPTGASARSAVSTTSRTFLFFSIEQRVTGRAGEFEFCVVPAGAGCDRAVYRREKKYETFLYYLETFAAFTESVGPGAVRPGRWEVLMRNATTGVAHETRAFVLVVG